MGYLSFKTNEISEKNIEIAIKNKYLQASKELLDTIVKNDTAKLMQQAKNLNFDIIDPKQTIFNTKQTILHAPVSFGDINIFKNDEGYFCLLIILTKKYCFLTNTNKKNRAKKRF